MKVKPIVVSVCACLVLGITIAFKAQGRFEDPSSSYGMSLAENTLKDPGTDSRVGVTGAADAEEANSTVPDVEAWFFRAVSGYPAAISFEPVVLFKNGEYYDVGEEPVESVDVAADKVKRPTCWGKWRKSGDTYYLTNNKGIENDYKLGSGNWFPAYSYTGSLKLKEGYERTSGGDYGNGTNALFKSRINFIDDSHFTQGTDGGIITPNSTAWNKTADAGTYKIKGNTIEMVMNDGKKVTRSFAFAAKGTPARATNEMIFIGGDAFTDTE